MMSADEMIRRVEDYRSGYTCGYYDAKRNAPVRDKDAASDFFGIDGVPDVSMHSDHSVYQFLQDAAGLCQSEANRWENRDRNTFEHWNQTAMLLRAHFLVMAAQHRS